jgi:hypothetical protein
MSDDVIESEEPTITESSPIVDVIDNIETIINESVSTISDTEMRLNINDTSDEQESNNE